MGRVTRTFRKSWNSTISLLTGLGPRTWIGSLLMATFIGAGARFNYTILASYLPLSADSSGSLLDPISLGLETLLGVTSILGILVLGYYLIGSIMEFVFTRYLLTQHPPDRSFMRAARRYGSNLFIVRIGLLTGFIMVFSLQYTLFQLFDSYLLSIILFLTNTIAVLIYTLLNGYITDFLVPLLIEQDGSYTKATDVLIDLVRSHPRSFAGYTLLRGACNLIVAIGTLVIGSILVIIAGIPLPALVADLLTITEPSGILQTLMAWAGTVTSFLITITISFLLFVQLPVKVFLRYLPLHFVETFEHTDEPG